MALTVISLHHWFFLVWYLVFTLFCSSVRHLLLFCYYHYITYNVLQLNISPYQLSYVTNSGEDEGLLFYGNVIIPFVDRFPKNSLYKIMTTRLEETSEAG